MLTAYRHESTGISVCSNDQRLAIVGLLTPTILVHQLTSRSSTHFPYKNWYLRGDNWLLNNRWEQLISMRNELTFIELLTWNDFGEGN